MNPPTWTAVVTSIGTILIPVVVAALAYFLTRNQSRSEQLLQARLEYYKVLAPDLNHLMCYMTFIGGWRDQSPADIINLKRRLDKNFYCAAPLFSPEVLKAYDKLMHRTFSTFGDWGTDARIKSTAHLRRQYWRGKDEKARKQHWWGKDGKAWEPEWDAYFTMDDSVSISAEELKQYRRDYDALIAAAVRDLDLTRARGEYTTSLVVLNAHAPPSEDIAGTKG